MVGAGELYLLVVVWRSSSLGFRRYAAIIDRKSPVFVNLRPPDTENFDVGFHGALGKRLSCASAPPASCSIRWHSSHPGDMHGLVILHARLLGVSKEGEMHLLSMIGGHVL